MVLEGRRLVEDAVGAGAQLVGLVAAADVAGLEPLLDRVAAAGTQVERLSARDFSALADTETPSGVLAVAEWQPAAIAELPSPPARALLLVLDAVQDPGNVGTMLRTAHALGAWAALALDGTADVRGAKVLRAAMGAHFRFPIAEGGLSDAQAIAERHGFSALVAVQDGQPRRAARGAARAMLVIGNEGRGVRTGWDELPHRRVTVPMREGAESLNAAVAAGILLYELTRE